MHNNVLYVSWCQCLDQWHCSYRPRRMIPSRILQDPHSKIVSRCTTLDSSLHLTSHLRPRSHPPNRPNQKRQASPAIPIPAHPDALDEHADSLHVLRGHRELELERADEREDQRLQSVRMTPC